MHRSICLSILIAISFKNVLKMIKIRVGLVLGLELGFRVHSWVRVPVRV